MRIEFTNNALARMLDRDIRETDVETALDAPDYLGPSFGKRWHARRHIERGTLEVIFVRQRALMQVLTAYWQDARP